MDGVQREMKEIKRQIRKQAKREGLRITNREAQRYFEAFALDPAVTFEQTRMGYPSDPIPGLSCEARITWKALAVVGPAIPHMVWLCHSPMS